MEITSVGKSGLKISKVIVGCMSYGDPAWKEWVLTEDKALPILKKAYDSGLRTFDTADVYSNGKSEEILKKFIETYKIPRSNIVILSKCYFMVNEEDQSAGIQNPVNDPFFANKFGLSRKHILDAVDASIKRLGTYIDVLQIHRLDKTIPYEEIMEALHDVVKSGKARYIGASTMKAYEFALLQATAEKHGWTKFISMQNYHNLLYREEEREMIPYCKKTGVGLIPWSPLARGALARPFNSRDTLREKTDFYIKALVRASESSSDKEIINRVETLAQKHNVSMAIIAISWSLAKGDIPIVGLSSEKRIEDAVKAVSFKLTEEEIKFLEEPYSPKAPI